MSIGKLLFEFDGRIGRWMYFNLFSSSFVASMGIWFIIGLIAQLNQSFALTLLFISTIVFTWINFAIVVKRLHDINKTGWLSLIGIIPVINLFLFLYLLFAKGTEGPNQYGEDPLLNPNFNKEVEDGNI